MDPILRLLVDVNMLLLDVAKIPYDGLIVGDFGCPQHCDYCIGDQRAVCGKYGDASIKVCVYFRWHVYEMFGMMNMW
jgi:hypothetical protein